MNNKNLTLETERGESIFKRKALKMEKKKMENKSSNKEKRKGSMGHILQEKETFLQRSQTIEEKLKKVKIHWKSKGLRDKIELKRSLIKVGRESIVKPILQEIVQITKASFDKIGIEIYRIVRERYLN